MAASGVAVMTSKISSEERKTMPACGRKSCRRRGFPRWLVGDGEALMAALRRENATEVNEG
jgi:hypothetical protein